MTYTYAILEVTPAAYRQIRARLEAAGYEQAFHEDDGAEVIDMHGIALKARADQKSADTNIELASILSGRTGRGMVELTLNDQEAQMDLDKAREVRQMLDGAIEAAVSDELIHRFLIEKVGLEPQKASAALLDFREMRQGSRDVVRPN